jgi:glycerol-3-phosphate dehydrogenase subunit C
MREGSLDAPQRHALAWTEDAFYNEQQLDEELRRVFDICHGCRRCFNLCDSFPRLFDLIDDSESGELDTVDSKEFKPVVDACTLCDMCYMTKCPYVPPHEFNLDFPHLMLRYRAVEQRKGMIGTIDRELTKTDRNGRVAGRMSAIANWASDTENGLTRPLMESVAGIDRNAELPKYHARSFEARAKSAPPARNADAPASGRKAVIYATCFANYNSPEIGIAAQGVLARNGVETEVVYPGCCGMPQLEQGDIAAVAESAKLVAGELGPWIEKGYDVIALVPSCALMMKFEWPLILPENESVKTLSDATFDITEYIVDISKKEGLAEGLSPLDGGVAVHFACHARAQNMGAKAAEMMRLIPDADVSIIERCSGHGGSWGIKKENFETAIKIGKPAARQALSSNKKHIVSECPLAGMHLGQGLARLADAETPAYEIAPHPIVLFGRAYGVAV